MLFRVPTPPGLLWDEFGLTIILFLVSSNLFSQTRDKFGTGSSIVIP